MLSEYSVLVASVLLVLLTSCSSVCWSLPQSAAIRSGTSIATEPTSVTTTTTATAGAPEQASRDCMVTLMTRVGVDHAHSVKYSKSFATWEVEMSSLAEVNTLTLRFMDVEVNHRQKIYNCFSSLTAGHSAADGVCSHQQICSSNGNCSLNSAHSSPHYVCGCNAGFSGPQCQYNACNKYDDHKRELDQPRCQNGGVCSRVDTELGYACECVEGFRGRECEEMTDNCASNPCVNDGRCENGVNMFVCHCAIGYSGDRCGENWLSKSGVLSRHRVLSKHVSQVVGEAHTDTRSDVSALTSLVANLKNMIFQLSSKASDIQATNEQLASRLSSIETNNENMRAEAQSRGQLLQTVGRDVTGVRSEIGAVKASLQQHENQDNTRDVGIQSTLAETKNEHSQLQQSMNSLDVKIGMVHANVDRNEQHASARHQQTANNLHQANQKLTSQQQALTALSLSVNGIDTKVDSIHGKVDRIDNVGAKQKFVLHNERKTWAAAKDACMAKGGRLPTNIDAETNEYLLNFLKHKGVTGLSNWVWLGSTDMETEGTWKWLDGDVFWRNGSPVGYANWSAGEPNSSGAEHCLTISVSSVPGSWNDLSCGEARPYLCLFL